MHLNSNNGKAILEDKVAKTATNEEFPTNLFVDTESLEVLEGQDENAKDKLDQVTNTFTEELLSYFSEMDCPDTTNNEPLSLQEWKAISKKASTS
ncbi:hypothetical protein ACH5RR_036978 [Cinchona calisaya]|uniref:Uncharacterized protein n=1 Tax=Cinchona calisaya TaxID=153742 RepID=A0ABD2Y4T7_9GENT